MCGRYVSKIEAALEREWDLRGPPPLFASYNVSPTMNVPVVRRFGEAEAEAVLMRWGLIPFWAKGVVQKYSTINATCERVQTAPAYRNPWKRGQRCLLPVNGFYEWQALTTQKAKQPWYIHLADRDIFGLGGLWESSTRDDGTAVESCTIITVPANPLMAEIHNTKQRMPLILPREAHDAWLTTDPRAAADLVQPFPAVRMEAWPVSTHVNNPRHDDAECCRRSG